MTRQLLLDELLREREGDPRALARKEGPAESKLGALDVAGRLGELQLFALEAVRRHPGSTASELAEAEGIGDPRRINRRLGELETLGLLTRGRGRPCRVTGRTAAPWYPTGERTPDDATDSSPRL